MSARHALSLDQFPVYHRDSVTADEESASHRAMSNYMPVHPNREGLPNLEDHHETKDVSVDSLRATQRTLYPSHAERLATIPKAAWDNASEEHWAARPEVAAMRDGSHVLFDGHHRAVAAKMRGDKTIRVEVTARERRG